MDRNALNTTSSTVTHSVVLELIDPTGTATPLQADLAYDPRDPFAVTAVFQTVAGNVSWTFGRELLAEGIQEPAGDGDVHVWPCLDADGRSVVIIELCSPDGEALVQARTGDMTSFVEQTLAMVPLGTEAELMDIDGTIASILSAA